MLLVAITILVFAGNSLTHRGCTRCWGGCTRTWHRKHRTQRQQQQQHCPTHTCWQHDLARR
jgi:hypothetical protein